MAKTLVLLRHAKAANPEGMPDHERPLAERGRRDAAEAGRWLRANGASPQVALVSDAARTQETFRLLAAELTTPPQEHVSDAAYYASAGELLELVHTLPAEVSSALLIAHNPGVGTLANTLDDGESTVEDTTRMRAGFPTASLAVFDVPREWAELEPAAARLTAFTVARG